MRFSVKNILLINFARIKGGGQGRRQKNSRGATEKKQDQK